MSLFAYLKLASLGNRTLISWMMIIMIIITYVWEERVLPMSHPDPKNDLLFFDSILNKIISKTFYKLSLANLSFWYLI